MVRNRHASLLGGESAKHLDEQPISQRIDIAAVKDALLPKDGAEEDIREDSIIVQTLNNSCCKYFALCAYLLASTSMICYNKFILSSAKFHFPLFLSMMHMFFTALASHILVYVRDKSELGRRWGIARPRPPVTLSAFFIKVCPIGLFFAANIVMSNVAMIYIPLSLQTMLKKLSIVLVMTLSFTVGLMKFNWIKVLAAVVCTAGLVVATWSEDAFNLMGVIIQVAAVCCDAMRLIFINMLLIGTTLEMDPLSSLYYFTPCCFLIIAPVFLGVEYQDLHTSNIMDLGLGCLIGNVVLAFMVNITAVTVIGKFDAVVLTFCSIAKDVILITMSVMVFNGPINMIQCVGYCCSVIGIIIYKNAPSDKSK